MPAAFIESRGARVHLQRDSLVVEYREDTSPPAETGAPNAEDECSRTTRSQIPLHDLDYVQMVETASITSQALGALLRREIPFHLVTRNGRPLGSLFPPSSPSAEVRRQQCVQSSNRDFAHGIARSLIDAKVRNQRRILQKLHSNRPGLIEDNGLSPFDEYLRQLAECPADDPDRLMGLEGASTRLALSLWQRFLPAEFPFERRSAHPPGNPVNACLSFGSVIVYHEIVAAIHRRGLEPGFGFMHATEDGRWSLALDLMEPFRPALVEALAMHLFGHGLLEDSCFETREDGGCYLNGKGRSIYLTQYSRRVERRFFHRPSRQRTCFREAFESQVVSLKGSLASGDPGDFQPFTLQ